MLVFGDPYHIANLCVTWASMFSYGETEKGDHSQVHHRQLLQSIHSLHSSDRAYSQALMDRVMTDADEQVTITSTREHPQRWLVNQENSDKVLKMLRKLTKAGVPSLISWALVIGERVSQQLEASRGEGGCDVAVDARYCSRSSL